LVPAAAADVVGDGATPDRPTAGTGRLLGAEPEEWMVVDGPSVAGAGPCAGAFVAVSLIGSAPAGAALVRRPTPPAQAVPSRVMRTNRAEIRVRLRMGLIPSGR
jgi:hypothetical protein